MLLVRKRTIPTPLPGIDDRENGWESGNLLLRTKYKNITTALALPLQCCASYRNLLCRVIERSLILQISYSALLSLPRIFSYVPLTAVVCPSLSTQSRAR